jgi:hypothetical protein
VENLALSRRFRHHEDREGHEDRITEMESNLEKIFSFLRALRVLRGGNLFFGYGSEMVCALW